MHMRLVHDVGGIQTIAHLWDQHAQYQWTYFSERTKQHISFFLSQRLSGHNLDLGAGWYATYPRSTAVDVSYTGLMKSILPRRARFDLESLAHGAHLPFRDHSFDSATMVSVWQYIEDWQAVLREVTRVCRPGAELYIVNRDGAGLGSCTVNAGRAWAIEKQVRDFGYDTIIEDIPDDDGIVGSVKSVCVALPQKTLFDTYSEIAGKAKREAENEKLRNEPGIFIDAFTDAELERQRSRLALLDPYPVTAHSLEYRRQWQEASDDFQQQTGHCFFASLAHYDLPELDMLLPGDELHPEVIPFANDSGSIRSVLERHGLRPTIAHRAGSEQGMIEEVRLLRHPYSDLRPVIAVALNSHTAATQQQLLAALGDKKQLHRRVADDLHFLCSEHKQRRMIDALIERKRHIINSGIPIVEMKEFEYEPYLPYLRRHIRETG